MRKPKIQHILPLLVWANLCKGYQHSQSQCLPECSCLSPGSPTILDCKSGTYTRLPPPPPDLNPTTLDLTNNSISHLDLVAVGQWVGLQHLHLGSNGLKSVAKSSEDFSPLTSLTSLDLSRNSIQVLHTFVFVGLPLLTHLNLSHNQLHTIASGAFVLPALQVIDLSHNAMVEVEQHLFDTSPALSTIKFSHNKISRLLDGTFSHLVDIPLIDFSHNAIMGIEDNTLVGINTSFLDLGFNNLRKVPNLALRKLTLVTTLVLDGNLFRTLETGCIHNIKVKFLSISHCAHLERLDQSSIALLPLVETITLSNNPSLAYFHPGAVSSVPHLVALLLTTNRLSSLEDVQPYIPSLRSIYLSGNLFQCHCSLRWIQHVIENQERLGGFVVKDGAQVRCDKDRPILEVALQDTECRPYILPLFPNTAEVLMGRNLTWLCKMVGSSQGALTWSLPHGQVLSEGECWTDRACVKEGRLTLSFLHPEDVGDYSCTATNAHGNNTRSVYLEVKVLNIQVFPVAIAATFVTLSWNTSQSLSRDFILQVEAVPPARQTKSSRGSSALKLIKNPVHQYNNIEVGHKMNSYTISELLPSSDYNVMLCLKKNKHIIPVSSLRLTTRPESYMHQLGIVKDYTAITAVVVVLGLFSVSCISLTLFRVYRFKAIFQCSLPSDSISTKDMMIVSPSEPESITSTSPYSPQDRGHRLEQSSLVDNEVASPMEEAPLCRTTEAGGKNQRKPFHSDTHSHPGPLEWRMS